MTADQVAEDATALAKYLSLAAMIPGNPVGNGCAAGAAALTALAANADECNIIASAVSTGYGLFQALAGWLRAKGHDEAAAALWAVQ